MHALDGFVRAGLFTATKNKEGKVLAKTPEWNSAKAEPHITTLFHRKRHGRLEEHRPKEEG